MLEIRNVSKTSSMAFMNFLLLNYFETLSPKPILFIIGEKAHSGYFSEDAYKQAAELKDLYVVFNARHLDLCDRVDLIPFNKLETFFKEHLKLVSLPKWQRKKVLV